ncbi:MAG TPA: chromate transporter [Devosiaceae bacterium]|nr:chromate transporter [Devosiaceae bacterium]
MDQQADAPRPASAVLEPAPVRYLDIFIAFTRIALVSLGGGLSGWMMREFVENRKWLDEREFLTGLALAQAFPGVNVVNISIWVGYRLRGGPGALIAALGIIVPPAFVAIAALTLFDQLARYQIVATLMAGAAAAAVGLSLSMGIKAVRLSATHVIPVLVILAMVVSLFVLKWPLLPVIIVMAPLSIGLSFWRLRNEGKKP